MKIRIFNSIDYVLLLCVLLLSITGISFIYSAGINSEGVLVSNEYIKQIIWTVIGFAAMFLMLFFDYRHLEKYSGRIFIFMSVVLIYTRIFGRYVNGAKSWIGIGELGIQPSELMKISFILFLAHYLNISKNETPRKRFIFSLGILLAPMALILLQPDLGTASVFFPIFIFMCFMADISPRYLLIVLLTGMITIFLAVLPIWETEILRKSVPLIHILNGRLRIFLTLAIVLICAVSVFGRIFSGSKYFYWITFFSGILVASLVFSWAFGKLLKPYQIARLIVFIDPNSDPQGTGWNIIQSKTAIGAGSLFGRGFMQGTQSHFRFLPQQSTDFIFSIFSEETGFIGGLLVFAIFFVIFARIIYIARQTNNDFSCYVSVGILGMLFFHFIVNVGMVMGVMPITGIPLPFLSYGGSALFTNMIAIGILMSINLRRLDFKVV